MCKKKEQSYVYVKTLKPSESHLSFEEQKAICENYAHKHGGEIINNTTLPTPKTTEE